MTRSRRTDRGFEPPAAPVNSALTPVDDDRRLGRSESESTVPPLATELRLAKCELLGGPRGVDQASPGCVFTHAGEPTRRTSRFVRTTPIERTSMLVLPLVVWKGRVTNGAEEACG